MSPDAVTARGGEVREALEVARGRRAAWSDQRRRIDRAVHPGAAREVVLAVAAARVARVQGGVEGSVAELLQRVSATRGRAVLCGRAKERGHVAKVQQRVAVPVYTPQLTASRFAYVVLSKTTGRDQCPICHF